jgi:hypothetical protein
VYGVEVALLLPDEWVREVICPGGGKFRSEERLSVNIGG